MAVSRAFQLKSLGQSVWLDHLTRGLIRSGELERMIREDGVCGITVNPTIFERAVLGGADYDDDIKRLSAAGQPTDEVYHTLLTTDIADAADRLKDVYETSNRLDGYVSVEVAAKYARDPQRTIAEAQELVAEVNRPNIMIKVPGTVEGRTAIRELTARGVNVNVTLMFSVDHYDGAAWSYIHGLEDMDRAGGDISKIASVASIFVSRIDTAVDKRIDELVKTASPEDQVLLMSLRGQAAIATVKLCHQKYKEIKNGADFQRLAGRGAHVQRVLWGSTSTKDPAYRDVKYVEALIGPETVNAMPDLTLKAFNDHGEGRSTLEETVHMAEDTLVTLGKLGVDMDAAYERLQQEGIDAFARSYDTVLAAIDAKRRRLGIAA